MPKAALRFWKNARQSLLANEIGDGPKITDGMSPLPFQGGGWENTDLAYDYP